MPALKLAPGVVARPIGREEGLEVVEVFIGPQHPASGHMRFILKLDGDVIVESEPDMGYVHRTMEKLGEGREWIRAVPLFERMTIIDACNITLPFVEAAEELLGLEPPPRARYLRSILCELNRIASHMYGLGIGAIMLNHSTMFMWMFGDREVLLLLAEKLTGSRLTHTYAIPGGVRRDMPSSFPDEFAKAKKYLLKRLREYEEIFMRNPVVKGRLEGVGVLSRSEALEWAVTGPNLRASGVKWDARLLGYEAYGEVEYEPVVGEAGDCYERIRVRVEEIKRSLDLIEELIRRMPSGPILAERLRRMVPPKVREEAEKRGAIKLPGAYLRLKAKPGALLRRVEAARGEVTYYVESRGGDKPYRVRIVTPSARNVVLFKILPPGHRLMDFPAIYASIDYFPPEADR